MTFIDTDMKGGDALEFSANLLRKKYDLFKSTGHVFHRYRCDSEPFFPFMCDKWKRFVGECLFLLIDCSFCTVIAPVEAHHHLSG